MTPLQGYNSFNINFYFLLKANCFRHLNENVIIFNIANIFRLIKSELLGFLILIKVNIPLWKLVINFLAYFVLVSYFRDSSMII